MLPLLNAINNEMQDVIIQLKNNVGLMLVERRRRWANIKPTLGQRIVFAGNNVNKWISLTIIYSRRKIYNKQKYKTVIIGIYIVNIG